MEPQEAKIGIWFLEAEAEAESDSSSSSAESEGFREKQRFSKPVKPPLNYVSSLQHRLPSRRGLSKHYRGKSQSFTSLSDVTTLEDLAKPENPVNTKLRQRRESSHNARLFPKNNSGSFGGPFSGSRGGGRNQNPPLPPLRARSLTAAHLATLLS